MNHRKIDLTVSTYFTLLLIEALKNFPMVCKLTFSDSFKIESLDIIQYNNY